MAQNLIFTFSVLVDNSPFTAGDKVYVYWDDGISDYVVKTDATVETFGSNTAGFCDSGSFEANAATWFSSLSPDTILLPDPTAYITRSSTVSHAGTYSAKYTQPNTTNNYLAMQTGTLVAGKNYRVTVWVYSNPGSPIATNSGATLSLVPSLYDNVSFNNQVKCTLADCSSTWKQLSIDLSPIVVGSSQPLIYLRISGYNALTTNNFLYIDEFEVKEITGFSSSISTITSGPDLGPMQGVRGVTNWTVDNTLPYNYGNQSTPADKAFTSLYQFCDTTILNQFVVPINNPPFPYAFREIILDSPSCAATPIICDIHFVGAPVIVKASNPYSGDGQVSVSAISSHGAVRYGLFDYGTYSSFPNTDGAFLVGVGSKTIIACDEVNCKTSIIVFIGAEVVNDPYPTQDEAPVLGVKYRIEYSDQQTGTTERIDLLERGYTGTIITDINVGNPPFIKNLPEVSLNNKFETIRPTNAELNLTSERDLQFIGLFSQDDRKYQIKHYRPIGTLTWTGFTVPSIFNQPYNSSPPYTTSIKASDNLEELKNLDFLDKDGNKLTGNKSLIFIVSIILSKLSLDLPIRVACNIKENTHSGNSSAALEETYQDLSSFYDDDGTAWDCWRVLESILGPFGAKLVQENGVWNIIRVEEQTGSYNYRQYTSIGDYSSTGSYNPVVDIESPSLRLNAVVKNGASLEIVPAYGKIRINKKLHVVKNLLENGSFDIDQFKDGIINGWTVNLVNASDTLPVQWSIEQIIDTSVTVVARNVTSTIRDIFKGQKFLSSNFYGSYVTTNQTATKKSSYALSLRGLSGNQLTFFAGYARIDSKPIPMIFSSNDSFNFSFNYRINLDSLDRSIDDPVWVKIGWSIKIGAFYYNQKLGWIADTSPYSHTNWIYCDRFGSDEKFEATIDLYASLKGIANSLSVSLYAYGANTLDYYIGNVTSMPAVNLEVGTKIVGMESGKYYWYTLKAGTDATSLPNIGRPSDYNGTTNAVVWSLDETTNNQSVDVNRLYFDEVFVTFNPNKDNAPDEEILSQTISSNYKENLSVLLESGDVPQASANIREIHNKQYIYNNYFKDYSGQPTTNWTRDAVPTESTSIQQILLKSLVNQYQYPTFKVSGSFIGFTELNFLTTLRHVEEQPGQTLINEEFTSSLIGWTNDTSGPEMWVYDSGTAKSTSPNGVLSQFPSSQFYAGQRIRVDFSITRSLSSGERGDWLYILMRNGSTVQQIVGAEMTGDGTWTRSIKFTISQNCTSIGFSIVDISGGGGTCTYKMNYFRLKGLIVTRYFTVNSMEVDGYNNNYNIGLMQLVPVVPATDPDVDDSGEGNTGTEGGAGGGTSGSGSGSGSSFSGDFNSDFGGDYDTILN